MPSVSTVMSLQQGYMKTDQYPDALEDMHFIVKAENPSGQYEDTKITVENFEMILDKESFKVSAFVQNLDDMDYNIKAKGGIDLAKVMHLYPIEGMEVAGHIRADIETEGKMSYILAEQYDRLPTSGFGSVEDFSYVDQAYLPQGFKITRAQATFTPQSIQLEQMDGFLGKSDIHVTGSLSHYMAYLFKPDGIIQGNMSFSADQFLVDEWMVEEGQTPADGEITQPVSTSSGEETYSTPIPKNIDFELDSHIKEVVYGLIKLKDLKGKILIKDGTLDLNGVNFNTLGGAFTANGLYDTKDVSLPKFSFDFGIQSLPLSNAYIAFMNDGKSNAIAKNINGLLSSTFKVRGELGQDLMPKFNEALNGSFSALVKNGMMQNVPLLDNISSLTGLKGIKRFDLEDVLVKAQIKDGRVNYQPFELKSGDYIVNVSGSNGVDGSLDFVLDMDVPTGQMGSLAKQALSRFGYDLEGNKVKIDVGGTYLEPKYDWKIVDSAGKEVGDKVEDKKEEVKENIKEKISDKLGEDVGDKIDLDKESAAAEIIATAQKQADRIRSEAKSKADLLRAQADSTEKKALEKAASESIIKRKLAETAAKKAKKITYDQATKIEQEANRRADRIMEEARKKAESI